MKLCNLLFCIILLLMITTNLLSQTDVSGVINSNTIWTEANSPYNIVGNVGVNTNANLTIEPGVEINYTGDFQILVYGSLTVNGEETNTVKFSGNSVGGSGTNKMLEFRRTNLSNSIIKYSDFDGPQDVLLVSKETEHDQETIKVSGVLTFENCNFNNSIIQTDGYDSQGKLLIKDSDLSQMLVKGRYPRTEPIELSNCNVYNSTIFSDSYNKGIKISNSYITNTLFQIGCCGSNFDISYSKIIDSNFESTNDYHLIKIANSILYNTSFLENYRSWYESQQLNISNAIYITNQSYAIAYEDITISNSTFIGCEQATAVESSSTLNISNCNFLDYQLALKVNNGNGTIAGCNFLDNINLVTVIDNKDIEAASNYWGIGNVDDQINDQNDDLNWGLVKMNPVLQNLSTSAPILPPNNLMLIDNGTNYTLKWDKVEGLDYKLYFSKVDNLNYSESINIGTVSEYNLTVDQANDFALTALNDNADGVNDQLQGNESWYATDFELSNATNIDKQSDLRNSFLVYPNPTQSILHVKNTKQESGLYELRSTNGKLLQSGNISSLKILDISNLPKGLYVLKFKTENGQYIEKVVKQ